VFFETLKTKQLNITCKESILESSGDEGTNSFVDTIFNLNRVSKAVLDRLHRLWRNGYEQ